MKKRGISPLIGTVLVIAIIISLTLLIVPWVMNSIKTQQESVGKSLAALDCADILLEIKSMNCLTGDSANVLMDNRGVPFESLILRTFNTDGSPARVRKVDESFGELDIRTVVINNLVKDGNLEIIPVLEGDLVCSKPTVTIKSICGVVFLTPCKSDCLGNVCGDDGCGGSCGECSGSDACTDGQCIACVPETCNELGKVCDSWDDGCRGSINCGTCLSEEICSNGQCISCSNQCPSTGSKQCVSSTSYKICGNYNDDSCLEYSSTTYSCPSGYICSNGVCMVLCSNECPYYGYVYCMGSSYKYCGNYDTDSCLEYSPTTYSCLSGYYCTSSGCRR